jgi:hypothetical protein
MATEIESVIAALRIELQRAEQSNAALWKAERCNRWIKQLPGAWLRRWENLKTKGDCFGEVSRTEFVTHVKATLAYLETKQAQTEARKPRGSRLFTARRQKADHPDQRAAEPIDADFTDVPPPSGTRKLPRPKVVK